MENYTNTAMDTAMVTAPVVEQTAMVPMQATPAVPEGYISVVDANKQLKKNTIASGATGVAIGTGVTLGTVFLVKKIKNGMEKRKASKIAQQQAPAANTATPEQLANQAPQAQATPQPAPQA